MNDNTKEIILNKFNNFEELLDYFYFIKKINSDDNHYIIDNKNIEEEFEKIKNERIKIEVFIKKKLTIKKALINSQNKTIITYYPSFVSFLSWKDIDFYFNQIFINNELLKDIDLIIGVKTGGYYLGYFFQHFVKNKFNKDIKMISCKTNRIINDYTSENDLIIFENIDNLNNFFEYVKIKNSKIIIIDDLVRQGNTMKNIINNLIINYDIKKENILTFSIFDSPLYKTNYNFNCFYEKSDFIRLFCAPWGFDT